MDLLETHQPTSRPLPRSPQPQSTVPMSPAIDQVSLSTACPDQTSAPVPSANSSRSFLTRIAAQERRVLEMREDLSRAEHDLEVLKIQWAAHQSAEKRRQSAETEKDARVREHLSSSVKFARCSPPKHRQRRSDAASSRSNQRVFSSSRHARALSLLSGKDSLARTIPSTNEIPSLAEKKGAENASGGTRAEFHSQEIKSKPPDREDIIQSGKQLVGDFRLGFWTFLEDLRQVTVGEDALEPIDVHSKDVKDLKDAIAQESKTAETRGQRTRNADTTHKKPEREITAGIPQPNIQNDKTLGHVDDRADAAPQALNDSGEQWDSWRRSEEQSPSENPVSSPTEHTVSSFSGNSTPRSSISSASVAPGPKRLSMPVFPKEELKWPSLSSLSPVNLTHTASKLMNDWEDNFRSGSASLQH